MPLSLRTLKKPYAVSLTGLLAAMVLSGAMADVDTVAPVDVNAGLSLVLPERAFQSEAQIAVELDGYDVTAFARIDGNTLVLQLATPLAPGQHFLNVLLFLANGNIEPLVERQLTVIAAAEQPTRWYLNSTFNNSYRADQKEGADFRNVRHLSGNGSLSLGSRTDIGNWQVDTRLQSVYDSVSENHSPDNNEWAIPDYQVAATHSGARANTVVSAGNIALESENLLFSGYQRRGAAGAILDPSGKYQVRVFGLRSEPATRYDGELSVPGDEAERTAGATATIALAEQHLQLSLGYLDGETTLGGAGIQGFDDPTRYGGDSWNLALDSRWLQNSLWLHLEYAESAFDSDGLDSGADAVDDHASQALLQLSSDGDLGPGWFDYWSGYLQYQAVGARFFSLGNLYLPGDLELARLHLQAGRGGLAFEGEWSREENNLDDNPLLPHQTMERSGGLVSYTPMTLDPSSLPWRLLGAPSVSASYYRTRHSQPGSDALVIGYDLDNRSDETAVTLMFSQPTWNWSVQHQLLEQDDYSEAVLFGDFMLYQPPSDMRNRLTALQLGWVPGERASLNFMLQWNTQEETDFDNEYRNRNYGFDAFLQLIPGSLDLMVNYNLGRDRSHYGMAGFVEENLKSQYGNTQLSWHAMTAVNDRPAVDFYLKGSYGKQDSRAFAQVNEQWSVHLGVEVRWAKGEQL